MYMNPGDFAELKKRVEDLYKAHEQELEEVLCFCYCTLICILLWMRFIIIFELQANQILGEKIAEDQFLDLVSVETQVRSVCKELYR